MVNKSLNISKKEADSILNYQRLLKVKYDIKSL
jgi:hypothetical protein